MSVLFQGPEQRTLDVPTIPLRGTHLIEASAGTGKTFTITSLILRFLLEEERPLDSILAVTFTNAATAELKERVLERIQDARRTFASPPGSTEDPILLHLEQRVDKGRALRLLDKAAQDADRAAIFTIHGFAARLLKDHAFESGSREDTELIGDERALVQDVVTDFWSSRVATLPRGIFEQIGGTWFYRSLLRVGLAAAAAHEVPLVELEKPPELSAAEACLRDAFDRAKEAFARDGQALFRLLSTSTALNRNKLRPASLEADYFTYVAYFSRDEPTLGHPEKDRFTQRKVSESIKKNQPRVEHPLLILLEELFDRHQDCRAAARAFADELRRELCQLVQERVKKEHERAGTQSFDGLLTDLCAALRDPERGRRLAHEVRSQLPVALIDEFQDTDPVQYEIFQRIYAPESPVNESLAPQDSLALYLIGDPKQSIYAFRGADVQTYLKAAGRATGGIWTLNTSYRSSPKVVSAQNALFSSPRDAFGVPGIGYHQILARPGAQDLLCDARGEALPGLRLISCPLNDEKVWLRAIADEVARFLARGHTLDGRPVTPEDIAVLTRTNRQAQEVQGYLRRLGIPAVMHGDRSVFESPEAMELRRVLRALSEPSHRILVRTALSTRLLGLNASDLVRLDRDSELLETWTAHLRTWGELWRTRGVAHAIEALSAETDLLERTLSDRDGERRMTNFRHLLELLHEAQTREHLGVAGLLRFFEGAISDPTGHAMAAEARQLRLESDADAVTLTTAHKSKGLEYSIVFLPALGLDERRFNDEAFRYFDPEADQSLFEMRDKESRDESEEIHSLEQRQESLRLAYVALTRAKHHMVALCGPGTQFSALHYLLHERDAGDPGGIEALHARLKKLSLDLRRQEIARLCQSSAGAITSELLDERPGPTYMRSATTRELTPPEERPRLVESEKTSSFSAMTRQEHHLSRAAREGRDVDDMEPAEEGTTEASAQVFAEKPVRSVLADFPRGPRPGDALHAMFEFSPFAEGTPDERAQVVETELTKRGFSPEDRQAARKSLEDVLETPFLADFRLGILGPGERSPEMEFSFPVGRAEAKLSAARLARALGAPELVPNAPVRVDAGNATSGLSHRYLESVRELPFSAWSGFLRGFMDLVFVHEGAIHGLDYKSNFLGPNYEDYTPQALRDCMEEHHYFLQALFYAVAIHRYAQTRIDGYRYETHFGGMHYLFLRGMRPTHSMSGVVSFKPPEAVILELSRLFAEGA